MARALRAAGIRVLENEARAVHRGDTRLWIAGITDPRRRRPSLAVLDAVPAAASPCCCSATIPTCSRASRAASRSLSPATHGGQVNLPLVRRYFIPSRHGTRYRAGLIEEGGRYLFVTRGVGTTGIPVRLFAPPEIAVLELVPL